MKSINIWARSTDSFPAHALASDIRRCPGTTTVIPRFFLQDFNLVSHPETGDPWYVPTGLAPHPEQSRSQHQPDTEGNPEASQQPSDPAMGNPSQVEAQSPSQGKPRGNDKPAGPTSYMLARQDLISLQGSKTRGDAAVWRRLMALNHSSPKFNSVLKHVVWREDMGALVLELMRRRVVEELVYYAQLSEDTTRNSYVVPCDTWEKVKDPAYNGHRGCVLWFGEGEGPGPRAIMEIPGVRFGRKIPVHNMHALLGREHIARLKEQAAVFREGFLFMLARVRTMELQLKLWKLQGYLAHPSAPSQAQRSNRGQQEVEEDGGE